MEKRHAVTCMQCVHLCVCVCVCVCVLFGGAGTEFELRVDFENKLLFCVTSLILRFNFWIFIHSTLIKVESKTFVRHFSAAAAAAAAKSLQSCATLPHGQEPTRLCCPCDFPGKNTGMGCHFLLQCMKVKSESEVAQRPHGVQLLCPWTYTKMLELSYFLTIRNIFLCMLNLYLVIQHAKYFLQELFVH